MKVLKIILSILIVAFSAAYGAFFGINKFQDQVNNPKSKDQNFIVYPLPQIISPKAGEEVFGEKKITVAAPGAKALYLSGKNENGDAISEGEVRIANEFEWDTIEYDDGVYNLYVTAYYQTGAPSKTAIELEVKNKKARSEDNDGTLKSSASLTAKKKVDKDKALTKEENTSAKEELEKIEVDKDLRVNELEVGQIEDNKFKVEVRGTAKASTDLKVLVFSSPVKKEIQSGENGVWEADVDLEQGRHQLYAVSGDKRSVAAEVYLSSNTSEKKLIDPKNMKKAIINNSIYAGGPSLILVSFAWLMGMIQKPKSNKKEKE